MVTLAFPVENSALQLVCVLRRPFLLRSSYE
jgi:hypothetical protein